ncbi:DedA family protein [Actinopolymorpha sp. B9G3]|uniref:DedA family protein n=1 Tax=Actinopolymorpha sp. B9G3 TaxID=3158970 RepID=UPI0032D9220C
MSVTGTLADLHAMVTALHPGVLVALTVLAVSLETSLFVGLLVPGDVVLLVAGATVTTPGEFVAVVVAGIAGALVGEATGYALGRRYGTRLRHSRLGQRLGERRWIRTGRALDRWGGRAIVTARFTPVVHAMLPVVAGTLGYPIGRFLRWCGAAAVIWSLVYAGAGALAGSQLARVNGSLGLFGYGVLLVVGVLIALKCGKAVKTALRRRSAPVAPVGSAALAGSGGPVASGGPVGSGEPVASGEPVGMVDACDRGR